jgi:acyl carrier protein
VSEQFVDRVIELAADIFGAAPDELSASTTPDDLDSWDSVAQLNLLVALEDEFSVAFNADDVERASSLGAIAGLIAERSA